MADDNSGKTLKSNEIARLLLGTDGSGALPTTQQELQSNPLLMHKKGHKKATAASSASSLAGGISSSIGGLEADVSQLSAAQASQLLKYGHGQGKLASQSHVAGANRGVRHRRQVKRNYHALLEEIQDKGEETVIQARDEDFHDKERQGDSSKTIQYDENDNENEDKDDFVVKRIRYKKESEKRANNIESSAAVTVTTSRTNDHLSESACEGSDTDDSVIRRRRNRRRRSMSHSSSSRTGSDDDSTVSGRRSRRNRRSDSTSESDSGSSDDENDERMARNNAARAIMRQRRNEIREIDQGQQEHGNITPTSHEVQRKRETDVKTNVEEAIIKPVPVLANAANTLQRVRSNSSSSHSSSSSESSESSSSSSSSDSSPSPVVMSKPLFVPKHKRQNQNQELLLKQQKEEKLMLLKEQEEKRILESRAMVAEIVTNEQSAKHALEGILGDQNEFMETGGTTLPPPDDKDVTSEVDKMKERENWEVRELLRVLRDFEEFLEEQNEKRELERRRNMTDEERLKEDIEAGRYKRPGEQRSKKQDGVHLQRYFHRGAFYMDEDTLKDKNDVRNRAAEYAKAATGDDKFGKKNMPKVMQVKKFGFAGYSTKYKGLAKEDTSEKNGLGYLPVQNKRGPDTKH